MRAATFPDDAEVTPPPVGGDDQQWRAWVSGVWESRSVAEAVEHASPDLAVRIERDLTGGAAPDRAVPDRAAHSTTDAGLARVGLALYRYVLRMRYRSTPFGLFAGVAPARIGDRAGVRWAAEHSVRASVDAVWLSQVIDHLERSPQLRSRLIVLADSTYVVRGERVVLPCRRPAAGESGGPGQASVRHTAAVGAVLTRASDPVVVDELAQVVAERYPDVVADTIHELIGRLIEQRFLISCLRAPMSHPDPLAHLVCRLDLVGADSVSDIASTVRAVRDVATALSEFPPSGSEPRRRARTDLEEAAADVRTADEPATPTRAGRRRVVCLDLRLDSDVTVSRAVADEIARAASVLARTSPFPAGPPAWAAFRTRFVNRYGTGVAVPFCDAVDPVVGVDLPGGYRGSAHPRPAPTVGRRDEQLLALAQRAALDRAVEVELTSDDLAVLDVGEQATGPAQVDLRARVEAPTRDAMDRGEFTVVVTGVTPTAGATMGRFLPLLDADERARLADAYARAPGMTAGARRVQVSSPPLDVGTDNVARCPGMFPIISLSEHAPGALGVRDLSIVADESRLWFVETRTGRPVEPVMPTAVDLRSFTHPWARLLCELPRSHAAGFGPFSWGAATRLPFLPRIRHGRSILHPASWRLTRADLTRADLARGHPHGAGGGDDDGAGGWFAALTAWLERWRVPDLVYLGEGDQQLRLDLTQPADQHLLRRSLYAAQATAEAGPGSVVLREAPAPTADGWFDGRAHEITLTLVQDVPVPPLPRRPAVATHVRPDRDTGWAVLSLTSSEQCVPELLTTHLPRLWQRWDPEPARWFTRPERGRVEVHVQLSDTVTITDLDERTAAWASHARRDRVLRDLTWRSVRPGTGRHGSGRHGSGAGCSAAEAVVVADSAAALAELSASRAGVHSAPAVVAASLVDLATHVHGRTDTAAAWLVEHLPCTGPPLDRSLLRAALRLTDAPESSGEAVASAWASRRRALRAYGDVQAGSGHNVADLVDLDEVLMSLLDAHVARVLGPDVGDATLRLTRAAALSRTVRHGGGRPAQRPRPSSRADTGSREKGQAR